MNSTNLAWQKASVRGGLALVASIGALTAFACSNDSTPSTYPDASAGTGGTSGAGGADASSTGGTAGSGTGGTAGAGGAGTGGATASGGTTATDGGQTDGGSGAPLVKQTNLVANLASAAPTTDPNLLNPWGLVPNPSGPFWVSDNHSGMVTVYPPAGGASVLNVKVPGPADQDGGFTSAPTGQVFNSVTADFMGDKFIVDSEDGTLAGWQAGSTFVRRVDQSADSGYKGLALVKNGAAATLVAANFHKGTVDVFDASYAPVASPGFVDAGSPALPAGYAPFNVAALGTDVYISYALQDADKADDTRGLGHGYVSVFKTDGTFVKRLVSTGDLDSPWGMAIAPASWGSLAGSLLVGNFGDGKIHAYDAATGAPRGALSDSNGELEISGLWALVPGPKTATTDFSGSVFFTAGPNDENDGVFGKIDVVK